jgi:hypothetical protein
MEPITETRTFFSVEQFYQHGAEPGFWAPEQRTEHATIAAAQERLKVLRATPLRPSIKGYRLVRQTIATTTEILDDAAEKT